jgi:outer membrane protein
MRSREVEKGKKPVNMFVKSTPICRAAVLFLAAFVLMSTPTLSRTEETTLRLTLDDAIHLALEQNLSIKQADEDVVAARANYNTAKGAFLPTLSASSSYTLHPEDDPGDDLTGGSQSGHQTGLSASWTLWQGGSRLANLSMQGAAKELAGSERKSTKEQTLLAVIDAYLGLLEATRSLEVTQASFELAKENREQTDALLRAGKATTSDLLRAEVSVSQEEGSLILTRNAVDNAERDLCDVLNLTHIKIVPADPEFIRIDPSGLENIDAQNVVTPEIEIAASRLSMSEAKATQVRASFQPSLSLFGSYSWSGEGYEFDNSDYAGGLRVSWSLFEGGTRYYELQAARADYRSARFNLENIERSVTNAIDAGVRAVRSALAAWNTAQRTVDLAQESYDQIAAMYRLGLSTYLDLFTAQDTLNEARVGEIAAFYAIYTSYARLLAEMGELQAALSVGTLYQTANG